MRFPTALSILILALGLGVTARAQQTPPPASAPPAKAPAKKPPSQSNPSPKKDDSQADSKDAAPDPDVELQLLVRQANGDSATLVKSLESYLAKYPESPRRGPIYRALLQSEMTLHNPDAALEYAEKVIAIQPEDSQSMYIAVTLLEKKRDDANLNHAADYNTRLIERVSKADPDSRPQNMTLDDWQAGRNKFLSDLYALRGRIQYHLHKNDDAVKDLTTGFQLLPNAQAAVTLGEIAEENKKSDEAIREYATAFALAAEEPADESGPSADREALRLRMGNLWHFSHDSTAGLGDVMLSAYDKNLETAKANAPEGPAYNKGVTDPLQFSLRHVDGSAPLKLGDSHGKVVVLNFWTTWCAYCNQMETMLAGIRTKFSGSDIVFVAVNADDDESAVAPFLQSQKPGGTLVFADGVKQAFHVESIPTVLVLDKSGKVVYRTQGFAPDGFADVAAAAITKAAGAP